MAFSGSLAEPSVKQAENPNNVKEWCVGLETHKKVGHWIVRNERSGRTSVMAGHMLACCFENV